MSEAHASAPERATGPTIPPSVRAAHADWSREVVWSHLPYTTTFRLTSPTGETRYLKLAPTDWYPTLEAEAARTRWATAHLPVPRVLDSGRADGTSWLLTEGLPGRDATHATGDPDHLARRLGAALRTFHGARVDACPFDFRLDAALHHVRTRLEHGGIDPERDFHEEHAHLTAVEAVELLERTRPPEAELVVCHGDYCVPNIVLANGVLSGFVDLGELGVADRWWDLAVGTWSLDWNLGPGHAPAFLEAYGVEPDEERMRYYRLLYDVVS